MNQKLNTKDFILIGVLSALMWVICMIISTVMSVAGPVTNICYPSGVAIVNGIPMMLLLAKVPKRGVFTISSVIQGILLWFRCSSLSVAWSVTCLSCVVERSRWER